MTALTLVDRMARAREETLALARRADLSAWVKEVTGRRAKDVLAHIAAWEVNASRSLEAHRQGGTFVIEPFEIDRVNRQIFEEHKDLQDAGVLGLLAESHRRLVSAAHRIEPADWPGPVTYPWGATGTVDHLLEDMAKHEAHHRAQVEASQAR